MNIKKIKDALTYAEKKARKVAKEKALEEAKGPFYTGDKIPKAWDMDWNVVETITVPDTVYHLSPAENKESILSKGLIPQHGESTKQFNQAYGETTDDKTPFVYTMNEVNTGGSGIGTKVAEGDVYEIDTRGIGWEYNPREGTLRTREIIPVKNIRQRLAMCNK